MPSAGIEPAIPTSKRQQTYTLYRTAIGIAALELTCNFLNQMALSL